MALVINDRVKETSTTQGTGNITLAGAVQGFITFNSGIGCLLYTSPSPRDRQKSRMPSSA